MLHRQREKKNSRIHIQQFQSIPVEFPIEHPPFYDRHDTAKNLKENLQTDDAEYSFYYKERPPRNDDELPCHVRLDSGSGVRFVRPEHNEFQMHEFHRHHKHGGRTSSPYDKKDNNYCSSKEPYKISISVDDECEENHRHVINGNKSRRQTDDCQRRHKGHRSAHMCSEKSISSDITVSTHPTPAAEERGHRTTKRHDSRSNNHSSGSRKNGHYNSKPGDPNNTHNDNSTAQCKLCDGCAYDSDDGHPIRKQQSCKRVLTGGELFVKYPSCKLFNQDYDQIRKCCLNKGILFEDASFPATSASIDGGPHGRSKRLEWMRPGEICNDPQFLVEGASRFDVKQGELGDCWLLAAVASLTCDGKLFSQVVPPSQTFAQGDYAGIFKFQFWHQGQWAEVVVDDRLPTYYGQLSFMHSVDKNEFWSALLEKAYAKLNGSYESLKGGSTCEAMEDFTGGITEMYDLKSAPKNLFQIMLKAHERSSMMGCSIDADPGQLEAELSNGLIMGHAYSITNVIMADVNTPRMSGKIPLVRIRNPWGNEAEWKGAWSDKSPQWNMVPQSERQELGITFDDDGEFWMSFQDFSSNFQKLEICNLGPDSLDEETLTSRSKKKWEVTMEEGQWVPRQNAGGCRNYLNTFWTNPQFRVTVTDVDEDDDEDMCTLIIGLLQKDRRKKRKEGLDMLTIGYCIYKLTDANSGPLDVNFFKYNGSIAKSPTFINMRESCGRHKLPPGTYCIIPSTFEPGQKGDFLLRIFTEKINHTSEIDEPTGYVDQPYIPSYSGQAYAAPGIPNAYPAATPTSEDQDQEDAMKSQFRRTAGDDMEIDAYELQGILNAVFQKEFSFPGFSVDVCRSMVAMKDGDLSGKLGYDEFKILWNDLRRWKTVFKKFDEDGTGSLNSYELRAAFRHSGFTVSNRTLMALVMRYAKRDGTIEFGDFVACAVKLKTMIESFQSLEMKGTGKAVFNMDDFLQTTMYS